MSRLKLQPTISNSFFWPSQRYKFSYTYINHLGAFSCRLFQLSQPPSSLSVEMSSLNFRQVLKNGRIYWNDVFSVFFLSTFRLKDYRWIIEQIGHLRLIDSRTIHKIGCLCRRDVQVWIRTSYVFSRINTFEIQFFLCRLITQNVNLNYKIILLSLT